ncbi:MAG: hypothetical protein EOP82_12820 [Variovorax sp.]|nr:MAG: hypothetical protein EOP82_12820 [Variovorax sp.]
MHALELIEKRTAGLMKMGLKSSAAVIQRVCPLIGDAREAGFSHRAIYEALSAAGLQTTWTNYRIALGRATKAANRATNRIVASARRPASEREPAIQGHALAPSDDRHQAVPEIARSGATGSNGMNCFKSSSAGTSTATHVMDALRQAREVANSKDYGQIARDLYRQEQRNRRRKDPP